jgi:hypothetical protein
MVELVTLKRGLLTYERQTKEDRMRIISELNSAQSELQSEKGRNDTIQFDVEQRVKQQNEHTLMEMNKEMHRKQEELRISKVRSFNSLGLKQRDGQRLLTAERTDQVRQQYCRLREADTGAAAQGGDPGIRVRHHIPFSFSSMRRAQLKYAMQV